MRLLPALALSAALLTGACATPDGRIDPGATLALTAGLAAVGGLLYIASQDSGPRYHGGYGGGGYGGGGRGGYRGGGGRGGWR
jgi:hypothetical protein